MTILQIIFPNKPWIFKKRITDDQFGLMWYNKDRNPLFNHYQAYVLFKPINNEIDAFFTSDKEGIDPKQKHFFWEIEKKYFDLFPLLIEAIEKFYKKENNQEFKIIDFKKEFSLFAISISRYSYQKQEWSLSYTRGNDLIHGITIQFKNWEIVDIMG